MKYILFICIFSFISCNFEENKTNGNDIANSPETYSTILQEYPKKIIHSIISIDKDFLLNNVEQVFYLYNEVIDFEYNQKKFKNILNNENEILYKYLFNSKKLNKEIGLLNKSLRDVLLDNINNIWLSNESMQYEDEKGYLQCNEKPDSFVIYTWDNSACYFISLECKKKCKIRGFGFAFGSYDLDPRFGRCKFSHCNLERIQFKEEHNSIYNNNIVDCTNFVNNYYMNLGYNVSFSTTYNYNKNNSFILINREDIKPKNIIVWNVFKDMVPITGHVAIVINEKDKNGNYKIVEISDNVIKENSITYYDNHYKNLLKEIGGQEKGFSLNSEQFTLSPQVIKDYYKNKKK